MTRTQGIAEYALVGVVFLVAVVAIALIVQPGPFGEDADTNLAGGAMQGLLESEWNITLRAGEAHEIAGGPLLQAHEVSPAGARFSLDGSSTRSLRLGESDPLGAYTLTVLRLAQGSADVLVSASACGARAAQTRACRGASACCGGTCVRLPECAEAPDGPALRCGDRQLYCCAGKLTGVQCEPPQESCGDGVCSSSETCAVCASDCGTCPSLGNTVTLSVNEPAGVARQGEVLSTGVPLPEDLRITDASRLAVVDSAGVPIPAEFRVLARWHRGTGDAQAPIKWVLVSFPATVGSRGQAQYRLVTDGSAGPNPSPAAPLSLERAGDRVTVRTGDATFVIGPHALFDEVRDRESRLLSSGGELSATMQGTYGESSHLREVEVVHAGPLTAIVTVRSTYNLTFGTGAISSMRRYEFTAGSPTAIVRHVVTWEGTHGPNSWWLNDDPPVYNFIEGTRIRDTLPLAFTPTTAQAIGARGAAKAQQYTGQEVSLRTRLREQAGERGARWEPRVYEIVSGQTMLERGVHDGITGTGPLAEGGVLAAGDAQRTLAVALNHMHFYEPQALRLLPGGDVAVDIADDRFRLAFRQGLFSTVAVSALPGGASVQDLERETWAPLNHPLRALPSPEWINEARVENSFPAGQLPASLSSYDAKMTRLLETTARKADYEGLHGLVTYGVWPRYWAQPWSSPTTKGSEIGDGDWAAVFMDTAWTDYYSTTAAAAAWAMRSGQSRPLDEFVEPAALRSLHTQIMQAAPGDENGGYSGQGTTGYGGYRSDFNSKHHYWENLYWYYYLTGDETVVDIVQRGGANQLLRYLNGNMGVTSAVPALHMTAWQFLGSTVQDPAEAARFSGAFRQASERVIIDHYAELSYDGQAYGFLTDQPGAQGNFTMDSPWTIGGFDMDNIYWLMVMTDDAPVGPSGVRPSRVLTRTAKTFAEILPSPQLRYANGTLVGGDGSIEGQWSRAITVNYTGPRVGGTVTSLVGGTQAGQPLLFPDDKPFMAAFFARAAVLGDDPSVERMSDELVAYSLSRMTEKTVMGKLGGLITQRLHTAVAIEAGEDPVR